MRSKHAVLIGSDFHCGVQGNGTTQRVSPKVVQEAIVNTADLIETLLDQGAVDTFVINGDLMHAGSTDHPSPDYVPQLAQRQLQPLAAVLQRSALRTVHLPGNWDPLFSRRPEQQAKNEDHLRTALSDQSGRIRLEQPGLHFHENGLLVKHGHDVPVSLGMFLRRMFRMDIHTALQRSGEGMNGLGLPREDFLKKIADDDARFHAKSDLIFLAKETLLSPFSASGRSIVDSWHESAINDVYAASIASSLARETREKGIAPIDIAVFGHTHSLCQWTHSELQSLLRTDDPAIPRIVANAGTATAQDRWFGSMALIRGDESLPQEIITWQPFERHRSSSVPSLPQSYGRHSA